jgi:hypothetical protein
MSGAGAGPADAYIRYYEAIIRNSAGWHLRAG